MGKRIAIVSALYLPHMGGIEQFTASLAEELVAMGHEVHVVTCNLDQDEFPAHESPTPGIDVWRLPCLPFFEGRLPLLRRGPKLAEMAKEISSLDLDGMLVNARFYETTPFALRLARDMGLRAAVLDHGSSYIGFGMRGIDTVVRSYERRMTKKAKSFDPDFYGISDASVKWLRTFDIEAKGTIHNAIDVDDFTSLSSARDLRAELGISPDAMLVAFAGRLVAQKGVWCVHQTAHAVREAGCDAAFVIAGDGPELEGLQAEASPNLHLVGRLERPDMVALLEQSDLFFLPSDTEGMATAVLEAAACGITTIGTDVGGMREVMPDDSFGIVCDEANPSLFAEQVCWYDAHREILAQRGRRCRERVRDEFTWHNTALSVLNACCPD